MLKKNQKIAISKNFIISLLLVCLMFAAFGLNIDDSYAVDLNESSDEINMELNVEDKLGNSQIDEQDVLEVESQDRGNLQANSHTLNGGTYKDIQTVIDGAQNGDEIVLNGYYYSESPDDGIVVNKPLTITSNGSGVLDGRNLSNGIWFKYYGSGSTIGNIKFINNDRYRGGAIYLIADNIRIYNCEFAYNHAEVSGGAVSSVYNSSYALNTVVDNCTFHDNVADIAGGGLALYGKNSKVIECRFISNKVTNDNNKGCFGGGIQIGMDEPKCEGLVQNCIFINNSAYVENNQTHGGAGCVRDGIIYENSIFINNSAKEGGALTYHSSGTIRNCTFINNTAFEFGGALSTGYLYNSSMDLRINDCEFDGNKAPLGGAAQLIGLNIAFKNSNFTNNHAYIDGGAINIEAVTVNIDNCSFKKNIAEVDGGAIFCIGKNTLIQNSNFRNNSAMPDYNKINDGLGGAIYVNSTNAYIEDNSFYFNTARNGSAVYYDKSGENLVLSGNTMFENQAWVYALPISANNISYGETERIKSIIYGGNNIAKYRNLESSNAIYNAADYSKITVDNQHPVNGATNTGVLYQDDREYNMEILLTVEKDDGSVVYNNTLNSDYKGEVFINLNNLQPGKYYVTARHYEDTYYKAISNRTTFTVSPKVDNRIKKVASGDTINYDDIVVWTLNITNNGPNKATNVTVREVLPDGLVYVDDDTNKAYNPKTGILHYDEVDVGQTIIVNIYTIVNKTGTIVNKVNITSDEYDINLNNNHDQSTINVPSACDLEVKKSVNNSSPNYNGLVKWTVTVKNNGPDDANNVVVTDLLPKSLIWVSDDGNYNKNTETWEIETLKAGKQVSLNMVCRVNATGLIENKVSVKSDEHDYNLTNNNASRTINVKNASDLAIVKSANVSVANFNDVVRWRLVITNNGPNDATGVKVTDILPKGLIYVNSILARGTYSNGVIDVGELANGESLTFDIICRVNKTGTILNTANITGNEHDYNLANNVFAKSIFINPACDLEVVKRANETSPKYLNLVKWTVAVKNNGPDDANNVVVTDLLPKSLVWVSDDGNYNKNTGTWEIETLKAGNEASLNMVCRVNATGLIENKVSVKSDEHDYDLRNNNASARINVKNASDLAIVKSANVSVANFNDVVRWRLTITNYGPNDATGVKVTDILPKGLIYVNSILARGTYSNGVIDVGELANGESLTFDIICRVNKTGTILNTANITGNEYDYNLANNVFAKSISINPACDLEVVKSANETNPRYQDLVKWTVTVKNNGPDVAHGIVVTDILPESLVWVSDDGEGSYNHKNGSWSITELSPNVSLKLNIVTRVNSTGVIYNNVSVVGREYDYDKSNNKFNSSIEVNRTADVVVVKTVNQTNPNYGDVIKWTITVKNNGPDKATNVSVKDILPAGLILEDSTATKGIYDNGIWAVCCLDKGEQQKLEIICKVNKTGNITNLAFISADEDDIYPDNNKDDETIEIPFTADLEVIKQVSDDNPYFGDTITWMISVRNNGPDMATNVVLYDLLNGGLIYEGYSSTVGEFKDGKWIIGDLNVGKTEYLNISCAVNRLGYIVNNAFANCSEVDLNKSNNEDSESVYVHPVTDLSVIKIVNESNPNYGDLVEWKIIVSNYGPNYATNVVVQDFMPDGLKIIQSSQRIDSNGRWIVDELGVGEVQEMTIVTKVISTGNFDNVVTISGDEHDLNPDNNHDEEYIYVSPAADLSITKTVSKYNYKVGDIVNYSIRLVNNGPDAAENVEVREMLDDSLKLRSFKVSKGTFDEVSKSWSIDTLENGETAELLVKAFASGEGSVENKVSVTSGTFDHNLKNNHDEVAVNVTKNEETPKKPANHTMDSKPYENIIESDEIREINEGLIKTHVTGNSFAILVISLVFSMIFVGGNIRKKR